MDSPSGQFGSYLHLSITDAPFTFCGKSGAHDWIDDGACRDIAHHATSCQVRVGAAGQVVRVPIGDRVTTDDIRRERGKDVQLAVANERVVARAGGHLEFPIPASLLVNARRQQKTKNEE